MESCSNPFVISVEPVYCRLQLLEGPSVVLASSTAQSVTSTSATLGRSLRIMEAWVLCAKAAVPRSGCRKAALPPESPLATTDA